MLNYSRIKSNVLTPFLAIIIGIATACLIAIYRTIVDFIFNTTCENSSEIALIFMPAIGGLLTGIWLYFTKINNSASVKPISDFVTSTQNDIKPKKDAQSAIASIFTIGFGGSLGPETPSAQIGAASAIGFGKILGLEIEYLKTLAGCGVAAGISAAFNAPIAGFIFVIEIIYKNLPKYALGSIMLASVTAAATIEAIFGKSPAFKVPNYVLSQTSELFLYVIFGVCSSFVVLAFRYSLKQHSKLFDSINIPFWIKPAIGGILVGLIGVFVSTQILGTGYTSIQNALTSTTTMFVFVVIFAKLIATSITASSGGQGGLIAPSLFLGAYFGLGFAVIVQYFSGVDYMSAFGLVGMGALLAGITRAPILGVILPFEMTQDYQIILPLTLCVTIVAIVQSFFKYE